MSTANEITLKTHIEELQMSLQQMAAHITDLTTKIEQNSVPDFNYTVPFNTVMNNIAEVYAPFNVGFGAPVTVMIEESPGEYRHVTPIVKYTGMGVTLQFDRQCMGQVTMTNMYPVTGTLPYMPAINTINPISLYEPASEPEFIPQPPTNPQPMTTVTPVGSGHEDEWITYDPTKVDVAAIDELTTTGEESFAKAMKGITTWP